MMKDVVALGELLIDFAPVSTDDAGYPTLKAQPGGAAAKEQMEWGLHRRTSSRSATRRLSFCGAFPPRKAPRSG